MSKVYVSTYAKYNSGSLKGKWLDLEDYADSSEFLKACHELHADEADPELMFQDFEDFPRSYYGESHIDPLVWDWLDLNEDERQLLSVYQDGVDAQGTIDDAREAFAGTADTEADFAEQWWDDCGMLAEIPEFARMYIDFEAVARDMRISGDITFVRHDGTLYAFHAV